MIQAVMLIALGFLAATLIGILLAPSLWARAYRLSKMRLEASLPLSLSEIDAARDHLRATYAVRLRRIETVLANAKQKAALQLVDSSRLQMQIATLGDQIKTSQTQLAERQNATTVLERTVTQRMPELEHEIAAQKAELAARFQDLQDLTNRLARREESLEAAQKSATSYQQELDRLRQAMEKSGADKSGRLLRRPSQWNLDDYRSEYDRMNVELSKLRQQVASLQDKDGHQTSLIKGELRKLAELVIASNQTRPAIAPRAVEEALAPKRPSSLDPRRERPLPYPTALSPGVSPSPFRPKPIAPSAPVSRPASSQSPQATLSQTSSSTGNVTASFFPDGLIDAMSANGLDESAIRDRPSTFTATPKSGFSRLSQDVTAKTTSLKATDPAAETVTEQHQDLVSDALSLNTPQGKNGAIAAVTTLAFPQSDTWRKTAHDEPSSEDALLSQSPAVEAEKAFADAKQLEMLSELAGTAAQPADIINDDTSSSSSLADEARRGFVIDLEPINAATIRSETASRATSAPSRNLLDRLRGLSDQPESVDK